MQLRIVPISFGEACAYVENVHRHHKPPIRTKFQIAVADEQNTVHGVALVGRPVSRMLDDGWTLEVTRCATDGTANCCSMLYRRAWKVATALGFKRLVTYTLPSEGGASLRGAGFRCLGNAGGGSWSRQDRPRVDCHPLQEKLRWQLET